VKSAPNQILKGEKNGRNCYHRHDLNFDCNFDISPLGHCLRINQQRYDVVITNYLFYTFSSLFYTCTSYLASSQGRRNNKEFSTVLPFFSQHFACSSATWIVM